MKIKFINYILATVTLFLSTAAFAHCPYEFEFDSKTYCLDLEWIAGQKKVRGQFQESNELSPALNLLSVRPERWVYSQANVYVWEKGKGHDPVYLENLSLFPFMVMLDNHSHGARSSFTYDADNKHYVLSEISFQEMEQGCWQIRMKANENATEVVLFNVTDFKNVDVEANYLQSVMCSLCSTGSVDSSNSGEDHSGHNHSHDHH